MGSLSRGGLCGLALLATLCSTGGAVQSHSLTAHVHITVVERMIGADGGSGVMLLKGHHRYRLIMSGIHARTTVRDIDLVGTASNLASPAGIEGLYHAQNGGSSIVGGAKIVRMANEHGVILVIHAERERREFSLDLKGMTISGIGRFDR